MFEIVLWSTIIVGGSIVYGFLGGEPAPKEEKKNRGTKNKDNYKETYEYFMDLSLDRQHDYISNNLYLRDYKDELCYDNKQSTAREVARRAEKLGKSFIDRYDRF